MTRRVDFEMFVGTERASTVGILKVVFLESTGTTVGNEGTTVSGEGIGSGTIRIGISTRTFETVRMGVMAVSFVKDAFIITIPLGASCRTIYL